MQPLLEIFKNFAKEEGIADNAFIVGGAVRDILLGKELKDIDIAIKGDAINIAKRFAREIDGSFVLLDKEFGIARVVKNSQFIDISILRGDSIHSDLSERDITINAMAIPLPEVRSQKSEVRSKIIDPYGGRNDLFNKIIRIVSEENLIKDPLRILRIYRFAATLNFSIEKNTLNAAKRLAPLITSVAAERIAEELRCIVRLDDSYKTVKAMKDTGILFYIFSELKDSSEFGVRSLELYKTVEEIINNPSDSIRLSAVSLQPLLEYLETDYRKICLKLSTIFHDSDTAKQSAMRLKMSKKEVEFVYKMVLNRNEILKIYNKSKGRMDKTTAIILLKEIRDDIYPLIILSIAQEPSIVPFCQELIAFYNGEFKQRMNLLPLITGDDLIKEFNLQPSPLFRKILSTVEDLVLEGRITSKEEALKKVSEIVKNG